MPNRFTTTQETLLPKGVKDFLPLKAAKNLAAYLRSQRTYR
jgi:hypothetical protein